MTRGGGPIARLTVALALSALAGACSQRSADAPPPGRGVAERTEAPPPEPPVDPRGGRPPADPFRPPARGRDRLAPTETPTTITVERPRTDQDPPAAPPPRDLSDELRAMMGSPGSCAPASALEHVAATVSVGVTVSVLPGGGVLRASVSAPGLDATVVDCLQRRAQGLRFRTPIDGAPRAVSATLTLERRAITPP